MAALSPIKGQALRFQAAPFDGPAVRGAVGYVAPQAGGCIAGATMEAGRRDRDIDLAIVAALRADAGRLFPKLAAAPATPLAGVRASTPDGLPLVGRSSRPDILLATGARRNGWLLAPLVGATVTAIASGGDGDACRPMEALFDPQRLDGSNPRQ